MKIMQFMGAAVVATMLGSSLALATTMPAQQPQQSGMSQPSDTAGLPVLAANAPHVANVLAAPQVTQQPKKLPLANFGQWDEAASEN